MGETQIWGILGTGRIAAALAEAIRASRTGTLAAVGSRSQASADRFADRFDIPRRHASYEALLADPDVQAVYISLPNQLHAPWAIRAAEAGKAILCEKPLARTEAEARTIIDAARQHGVFLMEAFMYRCHPQTARIVELVRDGAVGDVRLIQSNFAFMMSDEWKGKDVRLNKAWGGGGIMDVGCYCSSLARLVAGAAVEQPSAEPVELHGCGHVDPASGVDYYATVSAKFPGEIVATLACGIMLETDWTFRVWGTKGQLEIPNPWKPPAQDAAMLLHPAGGGEPKRITVDAGRELYEIEADTVAECVARGDTQAPHPCASWDDTLQNMRMLDRWRTAVGMDINCFSE
jgi:predicted dehydrogenase